MLPDQNDTLTLKSTRYEQPAFSSFSMYQDIKSDLAWRHEYNDQFSAQIGFTLTSATGSAGEPRRLDLHAERGGGLQLQQTLERRNHYSYDWVENKVPTSAEPLTNGREFTSNSSRWQ